MPSLTSSLTGVGILSLWLGSTIPAVPTLAAGAPEYQEFVIRDRISSYNVSFDSEEFDTLGDLDWRPIDTPYEGLLWKNFRVGANKHFTQYSGGKDAFVMIPLDEAKRVKHDDDPYLSTIYQDSDLSSFGIETLKFGCALRSGIPVECNVIFDGMNEVGEVITSQYGTFSPPYARMNRLGRLEAGRAELQPVIFKPKFRDIKELVFSIRDYTVLFTTPADLQNETPLDVVHGDSLMFIINGVEYSTNATTITEATYTPQTSPSAVLLEERRGHVTDCFDMNGAATYNSISVPWKDMQYDGFYNVKHLNGNFAEKCEEKTMNSSTGHLYAPGLVPYTDESASIFPSIGIDYFGSKRKDMSIKSFFLGCEQFLDENSILDTSTPCVVGLLGLVRQKKGDKAQEVKYQQISIARPSGTTPEDIAFAFVDLIDGNHLTKVYFVLISADPQATSVAIILDNLTYFTRKGKGPQTGNKSIAASTDSKINDIVQAISQGHGREMLGLPAETLSPRETQAAPRSPVQPVSAWTADPRWSGDPSWKSMVTGMMKTRERISGTAQPQPSDISQRGRVWPRGNNTFTFEGVTDVDPKSGFFKITEELTAPFQFGHEWRGRHQDAQGNPKSDVIFNNETWQFGPINATRQNFAFAEVAWSNRGTSEWNNSTAQIRIPSGPGHPVYQIRELMTTCYPAIVSDEDKARLNMLGGAFECHYTVLGFKDGSKEDPAEHAIDFSNGAWQNWRLDTFPKNFKGVNTLEFHATYASTRNVRILIDDIQFETF
ncbi:hypothetical protein TWF730_003673 [Orbilia blumenaviensis]|uniref:Uncharacterized protein n=1 Tax=Orbilia blumenaviensis TaxID=1796055 RepID=A0AAV9U2W1_9PEZI